jgi:ATP/maltotriose-dependent transcriptional regulator MalT
VPAERDVKRLERPLLAQRLAAAIDQGHVRLTAPAGAGKTWALEDALELHGGAVAWVRCTPADADPGRLVAKLVSAIPLAAPGAAGELPSILAGATEPIPALRAARALAAELARPDGPAAGPEDNPFVEPAEPHAGMLAIAVDDAHHLTTEGLEILQALAAADAPGLRIAVLADRALDLDGFDELEPAHLAFTHRETAALLGPSPPAAEAVWAATSGRPLLVAIAARSRRVPPSGIPEDDDLAAALLDPLPPAVREGLVDAALAPEIDDAVTRALELPEGFVEVVRRSGLPQREQGGAVVLHPLVRRVLVRRLERERPAGYRELLHGRVAAGLDAAGRGPEAVEHWLEVPERAAAAVARHAEALLETAPATVRRWLARIEGPERMAPELRALDGRLAIAAGRPLDAAEPLHAAILGFEARGDAGQAWAARLALADGLAIAERFDAVIPLARGVETAAAPAAPMTGIVAAAAEAALGDLDAAVERFERAVALPHGELFRPFADAFRATWVDAVRGAYDAALRRVRGAAGALDREDPFGRLAYVLAMQAAIHEERGEDAAALETIARARAVAARKALGGHVEDIGRRLAAGLHARGGRLDEAEAELSGLEGPGAGWHAGDVQITRATIAAARGEHERALAEAQRALDGGAMEVWRGRSRAAALLTPVLAEAGEARFAADLLQQAIVSAPEQATCARLLALRAWLRSGEGEEAGAAEGVAEALADAGTSAGHLLRRERERLAPLLELAVARGTVPSAIAMAVRGASD